MSGIFLYTVFSNIDCGIYVADLELCSNSSDTTIPNSSHMEGDFYSEVALEDLAQSFYDGLNDEEKTNVCIVESSFSPFSLDSEYIIRQEYGMQLYVPKLHEEGFCEQEREMTYGFVMLYLENLFSDTKKGTFQQKIEKYIGDLEHSFEELHKGLDALNQSMQDVSTMLNQYNEESKKRAELQEQIDLAYKLHKPSGDKN